MRSLSGESLSRLTSEMVIGYLEQKGWERFKEDEHYVQFTKKVNGVRLYVDAPTSVGLKYAVRSEVLRWEAINSIRNVLTSAEIDEDRDASEIVREMLGLPDPVAQAWAEAARMLEEAEPRLHNRHDVMELVEEFRRRAG